MTLALLNPPIARTPAPIFQEPESIRLEVFNTVPPSMTVHAAHDNRNAPLIRAGEIVIVEGDGRAGWYPVDGGLFLVEYVSPPLHGARYEKRTREIGQTFLDSRGRWNVGSLRRGASGSVIYCCDGPYRDEEHLAEKLIGRIVGLFGPSMNRRAGK